MHLGYLYMNYYRLDWSSCRLRYPSRLKRLNPCLPRSRLMTFAFVKSTNRSSCDANAGNDNVGINEASTPCEMDRNFKCVKEKNWCRRRHPPLSYSLWGASFRKCYGYDCVHRCPRKRHSTMHPFRRINCIRWSLRVLIWPCLRCAKSRPINSMQTTIKIMVSIHTNGWGMYFRCSIIVFGATFPHTEVRCSICSLHIVHEILDKCNFILRIF